MDKRRDDCKVIAVSSWKLLYRKWLNSYLRKEEAAMILEKLSLEVRIWQSGDCFLEKYSDYS